MPRISVLMPTHNRADVIGFAIKSVLAQTEADFELLIVGDGCTDNTADVVAGFDDPRIRWFDLPKAPHFGYANRNIALRQARGELIAFTAHDDLLFRDHLELLARAFDNPRLDWIYSRPLWISTDGIIVPFCANLYNFDELKRFLTVANFLPASCVMHHRRCFERSGYWPEEVKKAGDWVYWRRIINDGDRRSFGYLRSPTTLHFSASWRKSRHAQVNMVKTMLDIADSVAWWPAALKHAVPETVTEQSVVYEAMSKGGDQWSRSVRYDVGTVIDRLAWDHVLVSYPETRKQAAELAKSKATVERQTKEIQDLEAQLARQPTSA